MKKVSLLLVTVLGALSLSACQADGYHVETTYADANGVITATLIDPTGVVVDEHTFLIPALASDAPVVPTMDAVEVVQEEEVPVLVADPVIDGTPVADEPELVADTEPADNDHKLTEVVKEKIGATISKINDSLSALAHSLSELKANVFGESVEAEVQPVPAVEPAPAK